MDTPRYVMYRRLPISFARETNLAVCFQSTFDNDLKEFCMFVEKVICNIILVRKAS